MKISTIRVKHEDGFMTINENDFDREIHVLYEPGADPPGFLDLLEPFHGGDWQIVTPESVIVETTTVPADSETVITKRKPGRPKRK